jgi:hypothetical protein
MATPRIAAPPAVAKSQNISVIILLHPAFMNGLSGRRGHETNRRDG